MTGYPGQNRGVPRLNRVFALVHSYHEIAPRLLALMQAFPQESFYVQDLTRLLDADLRTEDAVRTISHASVTAALRQLITDRAVTYRLEDAAEEALRVKYSDVNENAPVLHAAKLYSVTSPVPARDAEATFVTYAQLPAARTFSEVHPNLPRKASGWGPARAADYLAGRAFTTPPATAAQPELPPASAPVEPVAAPDAGDRLNAALLEVRAAALAAAQPGQREVVAALEAKVEDLQRRLSKCQDDKRVLNAAHHDLQRRFTAIQRVVTGQ